MNLLATRSAAVAAAFVFAQACSSAFSDTVQQPQKPELLEQDDLTHDNELTQDDELTQDSEVGAVELEDLGAPTFGNRANSSEASREIRFQLQRSCPMFGDDVEVEAGLTSTGTTFRFTTESGDVEDLRRRVRHMGEVYGTYGGEMEMGWFQVRDPGKSRASPSGVSPFGTMPIVSVAIVDLDTGAQIFLTPTESEDRAEVRVHTAVHRQHLAAGQCWMPKDSLMPSPPVTTVEDVGSQDVPATSPGHASTPPKDIEGA